MEQILAERELLGLKPDGSKSKIIIRIGMPYQSSEVDWACPIEAIGLHKKLADIHGIDSFQALMLSLHLLKQILSRYVEEGGKLYFSDSQTEISIEDLFASGTGEIK